MMTENKTINDGMTRRDHFASDAMKGMLAREADPGAFNALYAFAKKHGLTFSEARARNAVEQADALIAELGKGGAS